jgi:hypothetical protein
MSIPYTVKPGDTLSSIARQFRLKSWKDIYRHDDNRGFRGKRPNADLIFPGDVVMIPIDPAGPKTTASPGQATISCDSKDAAVAILKAGSYLDVNTKAMLTRGLVTGIIAAEAKRMSLHERDGLDWDTVGPGQIGKPSYTDVVTDLKAELNRFLVHMGTTCGASLPRGCGVSTKPLALKGYPRDVIDPVVSDFFIAGYLAICVKRSLKSNRSADDQLQFGIGRYFGAVESLATAQAAISPVDQGKSVTDYARVKTYLSQSGDAKMQDVAAYIEEVYRNRLARH